MADHRRDILLLFIFMFTLVSGQNENYLVEASKRLQQLKTQAVLRERLSVTNRDSLQEIKQSNAALNLRTRSLEDFQAHASTVLEEGIVLPNSSYDVSAICLNDTELYLAALVGGQQWALRMVDAMGKLPSALLDMKFTWLGSYDECVATQAYAYRDDALISPYSGRYCTATAYIKVPISVPGYPDYALLTVGVCVPDSCSDSDAKALVNTGIFALPVDTSGLIVTEPEVTCKKDLDLDTRAVVAIVVCSVFAAIMVVSTAYDVLVVQMRLTDKVKDIKSRGSKYGALEESEVHPVYQNGEITGEQQNSSFTIPNGAEKAGLPQNGHAGPIKEPASRTKRGADSKSSTAAKYNPGTLEKALLAFSMYTNAKKILNTSQPSGTLSAVNGIRFFSMSWVILGHTYIFSLQYGDNQAAFYKDFSRWTFQAILNATVSVDSFFVLSGLLVAYLTLRELKKVGGIFRFNWGMYYFHRFWRLTPPYMLFMMLYVCLMKYWANGPLWDQNGYGAESCDKYWWRNLLYINNLFESKNECMGWAWYLANDMQFYVLSPLILIPLYYSSILGGLVCLAFLVACFISTGAISADHDLPANLMFDNSGESGDLIYSRPYTRIGPYVIGLMAGYILYRTQCKIRINKVLNLVCWALAAAMALAVLYGLYKEDTPLSYDLSTSVAAFYNATSRTAWGVAVAWVIVACATGNGGFVNTLLSWSPYVCLGRLTYCAYLVHPVVMYVYLQSRGTLLHFYDLEMIYLFLGNMCVAYAVAFVISLAFESPMMGLEKALLGRGKNS